MNNEKVKQCYINRNASASLPMRRSGTVRAGILEALHVPLQQSRTHLVVVF
jgi:hypothetical protein